MKPGRKHENTSQFSPFLKNTPLQRRLISGVVPGFERDTWSAAVLRKLFGVEHAQIVLQELAYNPGMLAFLEELKEKNFIKSFRMRQMYNDYPKLHSFNLTYYVGDEPTDETRRSLGMVMLRDGMDVCISKALGEAIERNALNLRHKGSSYAPKISAAAAPFAYEDIPQFTSLQKERFPRFARSEVDLNAVPSVKAYNTTTRRASYLPVHSVFFDQLPNEKITHQGTTNGCGAGFSHEQATLSALYELIERDALMLHWFSGLAPQRIRVSELATPFAEDMRIAEKDYGLEIFFLDTTQDAGVNSCLCVIVDPVLHMVAMGGKASHGEDIFEKAYAEAISVLAGNRVRLEEGKLSTDFFAPNDFTTTLIDQEQRETQCCTPEAVEWVRRHFLSGPVVSAEAYVSRRQKFPSLKEEYRYMLSQFKRLSAIHGPAYNLHLYTYDSRWIRECSFHVVRAFVPAFLKLHLREQYATPFSKRLRMFMEARGVSYTYEHINKVPHFFP